MVFGNRVGGGAFGDVYVAMSPTFGQVAVKWLKQDQVRSGRTTITARPKVQCCLSTCYVPQSVESDLSGTIPREPNQHSSVAYVPAAGLWSH